MSGYISKRCDMASVSRVSWITFYRPEVGFGCVTKTLKGSDPLGITFRPLFTVVCRGRPNTGWIIRNFFKVIQFELTKFFHEVGYPWLSLVNGGCGA